MANTNVSHLVVTALDAGLLCRPREEVNSRSTDICVLKNWTAVLSLNARTFLCLSNPLQELKQCWTSSLLIR